ncbi:MAG: hypothetical protein MUC97_03190 [Bernardetiaceae bacterium]|nr:hypothetical protein [Bernardetiaceae bacterium]
MPKRPVFYLGWLGLFWACPGFGQAPANDQVQEKNMVLQWRHHRDPQLNCSFAYPPLWLFARGPVYQFTPAEAGRPNGYLFKTQPTDSLCLRLAREPNRGRRTAAQLLEQVAQSHRLSPAQQKRGRARVNGREFLTLEFTHPDGLTHRHYFFTTSQYIWWLDGQFPQAGWAQFSPLLESFFLKIKI